MQVLITLIPDFMIIAIGFLLGKTIDTTTWQHIDRLNYFVLYPALLFGAASRRSIDPTTLALFGALGFAIITSALILSVLLYRFRPLSPRVDAAGLMQCAWRFNTALGFVAAGAMLQHAPAVGAALAVLVGVSIPLANLYAVVLLTRGQTLTGWVVAREVALNPFLLASVAGVLVALAGWSLPSIPRAAVDRLADAALPLVLLSVGAALRSVALWPPERFTLVLHLIKLAVLPAGVLLVCSVFHWRGIAPATALIFAALPTASAAHVLAARYGANRGRVALAITQSTALSLITLPLWSVLALQLI